MTMTTSKGGATMRTEATTMSWRRLIRFAIIAAIAGTVSGQECTSDGRCDKHERCPVWKDEGQCLKNPTYMKQYCAASCATVNLSPPKGECTDHHLRCLQWASAGECYDNAHNMEKYCPGSCGLCEDPNAVIPDVEDDLCTDEHENCVFWASKGECVQNPNFMNVKCQKSCGKCTRRDRRSLVETSGTLLERSVSFGVLQSISGADEERTLQIISDSLAYVENDIDNLPEHIQEGCQNRHELCSFWSAIGECKANEAFMLTNCGPACKSCHLIDIDARCPPLENPVPALKPGDLNRMFQRIVDTAPGNRTLTDEEHRQLRETQTPEYTVTVHFRPDSSVLDGELSVKADYQSPPWVITFDNFITRAEAQTLVDLGYDNGYERSRDVGMLNVDGSHEAKESKGRTSENAWCSTKSGCRTHEVVQRVMNRMSSVMDIPPENSEDLQLLRYEKDQFYNAHHDYISYQKDRPCGPRILTFFLYLSDVEEGGGTSFPQLDLTVEPKVGRALLWPSVLNSDPSKMDGRTRHEALPVVSGTKFGANGWYHLYDFLAAQSRGCT